MLSFYWLEASLSPAAWRIFMQLSIAVVEDIKSMRGCQRASAERCVTLAAGAMSSPAKNK